MINELLERTVLGYKQAYLVYQTIINHRAADTLEKLKKCFNFTNTDWGIIKIQKNEDSQ